MILLISLSIFIIFVVLYCVKEDPKPIFGVYQQKGKWYPIKFAIFYIIYQLRKLFYNNRPTPFVCCLKWSRNQVQAAAKEKQDEKLDSPQQLSSDPKAFDAVFFMATNKKGFYFVAGSERRPLGVINGLCYLIVPGIGLLCSQKIPDTVLFGANDNEFGAEGILFKPVTPMKKWKVTYKGKMWLQSDPSKEYEVEVEGDWVSDLPYFNFDTDLAASAIARTIATEKWTKQYFNNLKMAHQSHYEQMGSMNAVIKVNGKTYKEEMQAFRDHSHGNKRDWDLMHRYAFHMFFLENGMTATIGVICQPCTGSMLETGYVYTPEGDVLPVEWCDLKLYQHGECGIPPVDHAFSFKAGSTVYHAQVNVEYLSTHYVGWKWEARMVERFIKCTVNGIPGRGVSEFHYHNSTGRPEKVSKNDPQWFQALKYK
ncbi:uncharacterized protein LOC126474556 [Schistocerca serialis cubense]|uniref:uncharacterized protein LOC126474556 n=1 Tax=Schistocerca serialis cubense TaxID=2023355 RepID=UPI00214E22B8|nr:uncharacterized protein LOC126474556 [Schistocerca serialis cubense]